LSRNLIMVVLMFTTDQRRRHLLVLERSLQKSCPIPAGAEKSAK